MMREIILGAYFALAFLWVLAVLFGIFARAIGLTDRTDWVGQLARICRAVLIWSP